MSDISSRLWATNDNLNVKMKDNGDDTFSMGSHVTNDELPSRIIGSVALPTYDSRNTVLFPVLDDTQTLVKSHNAIDLRYTHLDGVLYGANVAVTLSKSTNWGTSWVNLHTFTANIQQVRKVETGEILVFIYDGTIWRSDATEANFTLVHTNETVGSYTSPTFGVHMYKNMILVAEYGPSVQVDKCNKVYMSLNYGATFTKILTGAGSLTNFHIHDVKFDPYEDIIWVTTGDTIGSCKVYWTKDYGINWGEIDVSAAISTAQKFTQVIPLPETVLFLTDGLCMEVWRYERSRKGTNVDTFTANTLEKAFVIKDSWGPVAPFGNQAAITYGNEAVAYFGFQQSYDQIEMPYVIWGTKDGYSFHNIWSGGMPTLNTSSYYYGIFSTEITSDGYVVARIRDYDGVNEAQIVRILPQWKIRQTSYIDNLEEKKVAKAVPATVNYDQVLNVASAGTTTITITPPVGELWRIKQIYTLLSRPTSSTSGTHSISIRAYGVSSINEVLSLTSNFDGSLQLLRNTITSATATNGKQPSLEADQQRAILSLVATASSPLVIVYTNNTNVTQSNTINLRVSKEVEYII